MKRVFGSLRRIGRRHLYGLLAVSALALTLAGRTAAELAGPGANDRFITRGILYRLNKEHLSQHKFDDEISQRWMKAFLKQLDPMKLYFVQADVDEFGKQEFELDDLATKGDTSVAYRVFQRFLKRVDERVKLVDELLVMDHDFSVDEHMVSDSKVAVYASSDEEVRDKWRKRIKYDMLVQKLEKTEPEEAKEKLKRRYHSFAKRMKQIDNDELLEMYLSAMTTSYDPHTTYMSPSSFENFGISMSLKLEGIGAALQFEDGYTKVSKLIPGGAAEQDGRLKPEDRVVGVGQGENGEVVDVVDMNLNDVVKLIRGTPGTIVRLKVVPTGQKEPKVYNITRASIELKDQEARAEIFEEGKKSNGDAYKIGVIDLPSFYMDMDAARSGSNDYKSTTRDVRKILGDFKSKGVDAVVLDLRRNGGGSLTEAINLTGLFIDEGPVVQVKDSSGRVQHYDDVERGVAWDGPLVVMISKFSASASEILAGAVQDYRRGLIIGDKSTHGKGTVQSLLDLSQSFFFRGTPNAPQLGALKITMQQFYRPSGDSTQNRGVLSDIELPSMTTHWDVGEADLDYAMKFDRVASAEFDKLHMIDAGLIEELRRRSKERIAESDDFKKVIKNIERYKKQKEEKKVTLNEKAFMEDRAELNADKEEEKKFEELNNSSGAVFKREFYNNEAINITLDYLRLAKVASLSAR
jgi:carboxyl-terminal processing protease